MSIANQNIFALLGDDEDVSETVAKTGEKPKAAAEKPKAVQKPAPAGIKPDAQRNAPAKGGKDGGKGRGGGKGGSRGYDRPAQNDEESDFGYGNRIASGKGGRGDRGGKGGGKGGGRGGGYVGGDGEDGRRPKREFDRRSGSGRGSEIKRGGAGKANWGSEGDEINAAKTEGDGEHAEKGEVEVDPEQEALNAEAQAEREREEKEMTLEDYEKVLAEKKAALAGVYNKENGNDRAVNTKEYEKMFKVEKPDEIEDFFSAAETKRKGKKKGPTEEEDGPAIETNFSHPRQEYTPRDSKGGKGAKGEKGGKGARRGPGGGRGERGYTGGKGGGGGRGYSAPNIGDSSAFPSLGGN